MSFKKVLQFFFIGFLEVVFSDESREHKVHNIVLYPEKHSWCQTHQIQQVVSSPGYGPVTIENNICVGACYSYSIPKTEPAEPGELIRPYCDSCQPSEMKCYHVNLHADNSNVEGPKITQKRVQIIMNCSCQTCDKIRKEDCDITDENTLELPKSLFKEEKIVPESIVEDLPDLLNGPNHNDTDNVIHNTEPDIKLKIRLKKIFEIYQNQNQTDDARSDELQMYLQKYRIGLEHDHENNIKIEKDLEGLPADFGLEGAPSHHKGNHIGMGVQNNHYDVVESDVIKKHHEGKGGTHHGHHSGYHPHHVEGHHLHHLGEEQQIGMNVVHLIKGPHGSMVLSPVEAKLHIDSDALQPNNEGVVIDYENPIKTHHKVVDGIND